MKYHAVITGLGADAMVFFEQGENFIILFNDNAPPDLADISVLHSIEQWNGVPQVGDTVLFCDKVFTITAIGDEAEYTLRELGHCTLSFTGEDTPERPGFLVLGGDTISPEDIKVGGTIEFY